MAESSRKTEKGNVWVEISIFDGRFEMLVTDGIVLEEGNIKAFLEANASVSSKNQHGMSMGIYTQARNTKGYSRREKNLRNRYKKAAFYNWQVFSNTFSNKGFHTADPLRIDNQRNTIAKLASMILKMARDDLVVDEEVCKQLMKATKEVQKYNGVKFSTFQQLLASKTTSLERADKGFIHILASLECNKGKKINGILRGRDTVKHH